MALYTRLVDTAPTPVVALNRAIAVAEVNGPAVGLDLLDDLDLARFYAYHAARADMLTRLGRVAEASVAYQAAAALAPTRAERDHLARQADDHQESSQPGGLRA